jgi:hypothetical protein
MGIASSARAVPGSSSERRDQSGGPEGFCGRGECPLGDDLLRNRTPHPDEEVKRLPALHEGATGPAT